MKQFSSSGAMRAKLACLAILALASLSACQGQPESFHFTDGELSPIADHEDESVFDEGDGEIDHEHSEESEALGLVVPFACKRPTAAQLAVIDSGNKKYSKFMKACWAATSNSRWCEQLTRPNPSSRSIFVCTYGADRPHRLIHPDERTWTNGFKAVKLVEELEKKGIDVAIIYNWWRPEPYNKNVGGAAGRHPYGTSVDVRFATMSSMQRGHAQLCKWRKAGRLRALGYYGSTGLHFGIGDRQANTWGKGCP